MASSERKWALVILFTVLLAYLLPYTIFTNVAAWYGSFLLWTGLTMVIIGVNYFITKDWGK
ncbi:hypothetical protein GWK91_02355 [Virgibacillus sp. MSP4-1]|uniref:hypothetical protein n=1 Tax=Virgibacillus sp. MSP4-1 TaxID=2700081 RepID=UPI0003A15276|nr:hypothetical protein [Virgibacillus sp. MSP4-1]QHS21854.1 hypothetical protein GWK91_02355 [Virgibacillus sp. MSP4-1]